MITVLITGGNGFVGQHLARELKSRNCNVYVAGREPLLTTSLRGIIDGYFMCDLTNKSDVAKLPLAKVNSIISLAGLARVGDSFTDSDLYKRINVEVLVVLCNRLLSSKLNPRVIAISTGAVYDPAQNMPLTETSKLIDNGSPYAQSKILMEHAAQKFIKCGLPCVVVRPFNHIGPGQERGFLVPDLYAKLQEQAKTGEPIRVGDLSTRRDYTDVRDVVRAYADLAMTTKLKNTVYNVCSGVTRSGNEILSELSKFVPNASKVMLIDQSLIRASDPTELVGSYDLIKEDVGWSPKIPLQKTIKDFVG